jgi:hypothetical protein
MTPDDVVGVESWPGFSYDLTSWKLWISSAGTLSVIANICRPFEGVERGRQLRQVRIGRREAGRLVRQAERIGFAGFAGRYEVAITDLAEQRVSVRIGGRLHLVECYGEHPPGFWALWRRIHRHAPLVGRYSPWWARGWWGRLLDWGRT